MTTIVRPAGMPIESEVVEAAGVESRYAIFKFYAAAFAVMRGEEKTCMNIAPTTLHH